MSNLLAPGAIIFINDNISPQVQQILQTQLFIDSVNVLTASAFDMIVGANPLYPDEVHGGKQRILVLRNLQTDLNNRNLADIVLHYRNELVTVEICKFGPPGITLSLDRVLLSTLFALSNPSAHSNCPPVSNEIHLSQPIFCPQPTFNRFPF